MPDKEDKQEGDLKELILKVAKEKEPKTADDLVKLVLEQRSTSKERIVEEILTLNNEGKLSLKQVQLPSQTYFRTYILSTHCTWFWITSALTLSAAIAATVIPENAFPYAYARYVLGSLYVMFLPGYALVRAAFAKKELERLEQIVFSIILSITLVILTSLLLNYTPFGITLTPIVLSLLGMTLLFSTIALIREYGQIMTAPTQ